MTLDPRPVAAALVALTLAAPLPAMPDDSPSMARQARMRELATAVTLVEAGPGTKVELIPEPIYRFDDPAGGFSNGTLWAFGKAGRPTALLVISLEKNGSGKLQWLLEVASLADGPLTASGGAGSDPWAWNPKGAGVAFQPLPDAPAPAVDEARRLRQLKEAARRFSVPERRLLPHPLHRYDDPATGLVDGAVFLLASGGNPEAALLIEARRVGKADPTWSYALARITAANLHVQLDGREVAEFPGLARFDPTEPYFLILRPAIGLKD